MIGHRIVWSISCAGVEGQLVCDADPDAWCRTYCTVCDVDGCKHPRTRSTTCNYADWIDNGEGTIDLYLGPQVPVRDGAVEFIWDGEGYCWRYAEETAPDGDPAARGQASG